jgi:hypothetical protein
MAPKAEWALVLTAFALSVPLWLAKNRAVGAGDVVEEPITLVPEDQGRLACMRDRPVGRYSCEYGKADRRPEGSARKADIIAPYMTTERALYLVPGLFEQPAIATFVSRHVEGARFTARCKLRLVEMVDDYELRFRNNAPWGRGQPAWLAEPVSCVTVRD